MSELLLRRRAMMGHEKTELPIMDPAFEFTKGYVLDHSLPNPYLTDTFSHIDASKLAVSDFIYVGTRGNLVIYKPLSNNVASNTSMGNVMAYPSIDGVYNEWWNSSNNPNGATATYQIIGSNRQYFRISFDPDTLADMYAYNSTTGEVYYAGINSPYYGKTNIND